MTIEYPSLPVFSKNTLAGHYYSKSKSKHVKIEDMHVAHLNNAITAVETLADRFRKTVYEYNVALGVENPEELATHLNAMPTNELALNLHPQYLELLTMKLNKEMQNQPQM